MEVSSSTRVRIAPNVGSYVGGDITAGTLASGIWNRPEFSCSSTWVRMASRYSAIRTS
ncbi:MAG: hypothetical protein V8S32_08695 [Lachnospiraceae bacterium]